MSKSGLGCLGTACGDDTSSKEWELRPSGMVVQVRDTSSALESGPLIKVKVSYGPAIHELSVAAYSTFGDLKRALVQRTGLEPKQQCLVYRGKEKDDHAYLHDAGVKTKSKIVLVEDPSSQQKKAMELIRDAAIAEACKAVADIHEEVDKLAEKVFAVEAAVKSGRRLRESAITEPTELLMCELLKLDGIKAEGDAKSQRSVLTRRVQKYVETLDLLKIQNDMPKSHSSTVVTTTWEKFDTGFGGLSISASASAPISQHKGGGRRTFPQSAASSVTVQLTDWERFD